jgi:hypothetical protein
VSRGLSAPLSSPHLDASVGRTSEDQDAEPATTKWTASFILRSSIKEPHLSFPCHPASPRPSYLTRVRRSRQVNTPHQVGQIKTRRGSPKRQSRHVVRPRRHLHTRVRPKPYPRLLIGFAHFRDPLVPFPPPNAAINWLPRLLEFLLARAPLGHAGS